MQRYSITRYLLVISAAAFFMMVSVPNTFAQGHGTPTLNSCIKEFYDPGMYNYLSFRNTCTQSLTIVFRSQGQFRR